MARTAQRPIAALAAGAVLSLVALGLAGCGDDDTDTAGTAGTTTTTATTTTDPDDANGTDDGPDTTVSPDVRAFAMWPDVDGDDRFDDPVEAARSFVTEVVGIADPDLGDFQQGDSRSGEIELLTADGELASTILVRQLVDDDWWVLGAVGPDLLVDDPQPQSAVDHPAQVAGQAPAGRGDVQVSVFADGSTDPIGSGAVAVPDGDGVSQFAGEVAIDVPQGGWGALVAHLEGPDGELVAVTAVRVGFIGGD